MFPSRKAAEVWKWMPVFGATAPPQWAMASITRFPDHNQRRTTVGRTHLDELSARRRDLYLTTHNTHNRLTSIPPVGFEPTIWGRRVAAELRVRPRGHWDRIWKWIPVFICLNISNNRHHTLLRSAKVMNKWSYNSTPPPVSQKKVLLVHGGTISIFTFMGQVGWFHSVAVHTDPEGE